MAAAVRWRKLQPSRRRLPFPSKKMVPKSTSPAERASRLIIRMPKGETIEVNYHKENTVDMLLEFLCSGKAIKDFSMGVEELLEGYALLNRAAFPPKELEGDEGTLGNAGIEGGMTLVLQKRGAVIQKGEPRKIGKLKPKVNKPKKVATSTLELPGGRIKGTLTGSYTFADEAFSKAGMLVICTEPTPAGDQVLAELQQELHFLSFGFRLPDTTHNGSTPDLHSWRDDLHEAMRWIQMQHPQLIIRALVGHGAAADVCRHYACEYGSGASCPTRMLVQLGGSHGSGGKSEWPVGNWKLLSIVGSKDGDSRVPAELFHAKHQDKGHKLRRLEGANKAFDDQLDKVASSINDWIEGARRLNADDSSGWAEGRAEQKKVEEKTPKVEGPPVGTMQAVREIQSECLPNFRARRFREPWAST